MIRVHDLRTVCLLLRFEFAAFVFVFCLLLANFHFRNTFLSLTKCSHINYFLSEQALCRELYWCWYASKFIPDRKQNSNPVALFPAAHRRTVLYSVYPVIISD